MKRVFIISVFVFLFTAAVFTGPVSVSASEESVPGTGTETGYTAEELMTPEKIGYDDFVKYGIGEKTEKGEISCAVRDFDGESGIICSYNRMIGEAVVEGDSFRYRFDTETGEMLDRSVRWRDDLPEELPPGIMTAREAFEHEAVLAVGGEPENAVLYYISPESDVFPLDSAAENPCRVVGVRESGPCGAYITVIIDAVTREFLGYGSRPPSSGYHTYYFPYIRAGAGYWTGIGLLNTQVYGDTQVSIDIRKQDGSLISSEEMIMAPLEQRSFVVDSDPPAEGWMRIISDHPLRGVGFFGTEGPGRVMADITPIPSLSDSLIVPHIAQDRNWDTIVMICNPNITDTELTVNIYGKKGEISPPVFYTVPARGSGVYHVADMLPGPAYGDPGSIHISSVRRIAGFVLYSDLKSGGNCHAGISLIENPYEYSSSLTPMLPPR